MHLEETESAPTIGFYAVVEDAQCGYFGGLLITNEFARPVEFHCTTPVKPNRAQEILYGVTLQQFLYGELIGKSLLEKLKNQPKLICVNKRPSLALGDNLDFPVVWVLHEDELAERTAVLSSRHGEIQFGSSRQDDQRDSVIVVGRNRCVPHERWVQKRELLLSRLMGIPPSIDLLEPFERICRAIEEASQAA